MITPCLDFISFMINNMTQQNIEICVAEELIPDNLPEERPGKECSIYILLLNYQQNKYGTPFVKLFGTDFTKASYFKKNRIYFDDCVLRDGKPIDTDFVSTFDGGEFQIGKFLLKNQLPPASTTPAEGVFERKILCEISGFVKNYNNTVDFNKCFPELLTKEKILHRVKNLSDQHLIIFLRRLISNCPQPWIKELNKNYGLDKIADELVDNDGNVSNSGFFTQQANSNILSQNFNPGNIRLLTDNPHGNATENNTNNLQNDDNIMNDIGDGLSHKIMKAEELSFSEEDNDEREGEVIILEDRDILTNNANTQNIPRPSSNEFVTANDTNIIIPETQTHLEKTQIQHEEIISAAIPQDISNDGENYSGFVDYYACGFSPNKEEPLLVHDFITDKIMVNDSFEIYLKRSLESNKIYTISFDNPTHFLFDPALEITLRLENEPQLYEAVTAKFTKNVVVKLPNTVHKRLVEVEDDIVLTIEETDF